MTRGIFFIVNQQVGDVLRGLLTELEASKYYWHIIPSQTEALDSSFKKDIFKNEYYVGKELLNCNFHDSYIIFLKLAAYAEKCDEKDMLTYADFKASNCQMLFLVHDCKYVEIYVKSIHLLQAIEAYVQKTQCGCYQIKTDKNDVRTKLNVL